MSKITILFLDHMNTIGGSQLFLTDVILNIDRERFSVYANLPLCSQLKDIIDDYVDFVPAVIPQLRYNNPFGFLKFIVVAYKIRKYIKDYDINLIFSNSLPGQMVARLCIHRRNIRVIWYIHDHLYPKYLTKILSKNTDRIFVNSKSMRYLSGEKYSLSLDNIFVLYNFINIKLFDEIATQERLSIGQFGDSTKVGILGRIAYWKGHQIFLEIAQLVLSQERNVAFYIVGNGEDKLVRYIVEFIRSNNLSKHIFLIKNKEYHESLNILNQMDVIANCSVEPEPFGRTLIEAMAFSKPVIAFRQGGPSEIIVQNETGYLVPFGDINEFADRVLCLVQNPELRKRMGKKGRRRVEAKFNKDLIIRKLEQEIEVVCSHQSYY